MIYSILLWSRVKQVFVSVLSHRLNDGERKISTDFTRNIYIWLIVAYFRGEINKQIQVLKLRHNKIKELKKFFYIYLTKRSCLL